MNTKKLSLLLVILLSLTTTGVVGYMAIESWSFIDSLYMTIVTLTTTGYQEVRPLSESGRIFTMFFMVLGFASFAYILSQIVKEIVEVEFNQIFWRKNMRKKIQLLTNHSIVCGFGQMGRHIAEELMQNDQNFVVIEGNPQRTEELADLGYPHIIGNASSDDTLIAAGIERAKHLITIVSSDSENVFISLSARALNKDLTIIARANEESAEEKLKKAGADKVVSPYHITSAKITQAVINPAIEDFLEIVNEDKTIDFRLADIIVTAESEYQGKELAETDFKSQGIVVVAIQRQNGELIYAPTADHKVFTGDRLIALGHGPGITQIVSTKAS